MDRWVYYFRYIITPCSGLTGGLPLLLGTDTGRMTRPQASLRNLSHLDLASQILDTIPPP